MTKNANETFIEQLQANARDRFELEIKLMNEEQFREFLEDNFTGLVEYTMRRNAELVRRIMQHHSEEHISARHYIASQIYAQHHPSH